jgi:CelD/BcsL family acetyltransferase involved in cellulose biosynthesis
LNIKTVTQPADFSALENEWKALSQNSNSDNVFLTWEWISTWWECFSTGRQPCILTARKIHDGQLLGLAPLNVRRRTYKKIISYRELSFMENQAAAPDHLDIISGAGFEEDIAEAFANYILENRSKWDAIKLDNAASESLFVRHILEKKPSGAMISYQPCPYIQLTETWENYLSALSKNARHNILRYGNRLRKEYPDQVNYWRVEKKDDLLKMTDIFFSLHLDRKSEQQQDSTLSDQQLLIFIQKIVHKFHENGWLHFYILTVQQEPVAAILCFFYKGIFSCYQQGHNPSWAVFGPGGQMIAYAVQQAILNGARECDFLRGDELYKYRWTKTTHNDIYFAMPTSSWGQFLFKMRNIGQGIKHKYQKNETKRL